MAAMEQRRAIRVPFFAGVDVLVPATGRSFQSRTFDISRFGVGLTASGSWQAGMVIVMSFDLSGPRGSRVVEQVHGRVVHTRADEDGTVIGVEFLVPLQESVTPVLFARMMAT